MKRPPDLSVYVIFDIEYIESLKKIPLKCLLSAVQGGATAVQLRSKYMDDRSFYIMALKAKKICRRHNCAFIINDRVAAAMASGADGVHVGQSDLPYAAVKKLVKKSMLIGLSASNINEAAACDRLKADYVGVGPVFSTPQKMTGAMGIDALKKIAAKITTPLVAIGGINGYNIGRLKNIGIKNFSFISAVFSADDIRGRTRSIKSIINSKEI